MMASKTFTKVGDQPACPSDKAEKLAEDLRQLKKSRKRSRRSNTHDRDAQPSPPHSSAIHIIYDSEGKRITKHPRRERRRSMLQGVPHAHV